MAVLKYYDGSDWEPVVSALQGPTGATGTNGVTGATGPTGSSAPNNNYLINGSFAVSQRGTSFASGANNNDAYTLDRWYILSDGNDAIDVTQDTSTVPTNGQFAIALDVETANKKFGIAQIIENKNCLGLIGNTATFSFKAKVSATTKLDNVKAAIVAWSGTSDSVTSDIISAWGAEGTNPTLIANATFENTPANLNVTTSYATYSVTAAIDTASTKNVIVFIWSDVTDTTAGDFLYISEAKLEIGSSATAFDGVRNSFSNELALCQRYYYLHASGSGKTIGIGFNASATAYFAGIHFPVTMRDTPNLVSTTGTDYYSMDRNGATDSVNSLTIQRASTTATTVFNDTQVSGTSGQAGYVYSNNASASVAFNAEL
jgi:hypothetical protein